MSDPITDPIPPSDRPDGPPIPVVPEMICFALYSAAHAMQRVYQPLLAPLGLTYPQYLVLALLWAQDGRSVGDLGRRGRGGACRGGRGCAVRAGCLRRRGTAGEGAHGGRDYHRRTV